MKKFVFLCVSACLFFTDVSAQLPELYYQCGNTLVLNDLGLESDAPETDIQGADILRGEGTGNLVIIPTSRTVHISGIWQEDQRDTVLSLSVIRPPKPHFEFVQNGVVVEKFEYDTAATNIIQLRPDPEFALACPEDTNYFYHGPVLAFQPSKAADIIEIPVFSNEKVTSARLRIQQSQSSVIKEWLKLEAVSRKNIEGKSFKEPFAPNELMVNY